MADKDKLSVEEILAMARRQDGSGESESAPAASSSEESGGSPEPAPAASDAPASDAPASPAAGSGKKPGQMNVQEMLAAARAEKSKGEDAPAKSAETPAAEAPSSSGPKKKPGQMSVQEMLAAARGEKTQAAAKPAAKEKAAAKAKPAAKPAAAKGAGKAAEPVAGGPKDTTSILAAARKAAKPGPMSKAEAAERAKTAPQKSAAKAKPSVPPMPEKPAYAQRSQPASAQAEGDSRRGFFAAMTGVLFGSSLALGFTSLAVTHVLWLLGLARFMFPNVLTEPPTKFKVGFPDSYAPGQVETKYKAQFGVWVVRFEYEGQQQVYALKSVCTHLGCTPNWLEGEQKFKCPCHGSGFYKDGVNFEGPAPRPLERYAIRLADDGQLEVDKSATFQQELGQWTDSSSYYAV